MIKETTERKLAYALWYAMGEARNTEAKALLRQAYDLAQQACQIENKEEL